MKTKEELNALKEKVETVSKKPHALSDDELEQVNGGIDCFLNQHDMLDQINNMVENSTLLIGADGAIDISGLVIKRNQ